MKVSIAMQSESATKKQQDNAKLLFGAKGKTLVTAIDALSKMKKSLDEDQLALFNSAQEFLKTSLDEKTIARLKKRKGFTTLPTRLAKLVKAKTKHNVTIKASSPERKSWKSVEKTLLANTGKGSTKNIDPNLEALFGKAKAKKVKSLLPKLKESHSKFNKVGMSSYKTLLDFLKSDLSLVLPKLSKRADIAKLPTLLPKLHKLTTVQLSSWDLADSAFKGLPTFTKLLSGEVAKAQGIAMDKKSETEAKKGVNGKSKVKVGLRGAKTVAQDVGITQILNVEPDFLTSIIKGAALKDVSHKNNTTEFKAKGTLEEVGIRILKQLRKKPEFKDSMLDISNNSDSFINLNDGSSNSIQLIPNQGVYTLTPTTLKSPGNVLTDGTKLYAGMQTLSNIDNVRSTYSQGAVQATDPASKRSFKKSANTLEKLTSGLEMGTTFAKLRSTLSALVPPVMERLESAVPEITRILTEYGTTTKK